MNILKIILSIFLFFKVYAKTDEVSIEEKLNMTTMELIKAQGYYGEQYEVETPDGYILLLHRIPCGKKDSSYKKKIPVFVIHGIGCESTIWIDQGEKSLAFLLANNDYDVWLGNFRGNRNSFHKIYSRYDPRFWDFTWDDHAMYDLPPMWDFVMERTGFSKIYGIGLSLGVATTLANLAADEKYNSKFLGFFGMGPVTRLSYSTIQYKMAITTVPILNVVGSILLIPAKNIPGTPLCSPNCTDSELLLNKHVNSGTSLKALLHGLQLISSKEFFHFDYNLIGNLIMYNSFSPPSYDLTNVKIPVSLYSSAIDELATPVDVARLQIDLKNVVHHRIVENDLFTHNDFIFHPKVDEYVYNCIIEDMKSMQAYECEDKSQTEFCQLNVFNKHMVP